MSVYIGVWGGSVAEGFKDDELGGWVTRLKVYLMAKDDYSGVHNCGVSGDTSHQLLKRFQIEAEARAPDVVVFAIGKNDSAVVCNVDEENFEKNLNRLVDDARRFCKNIIFVGIENIDESKTSPFPKGQMPYYANERVVKYNSIIERVCKENELGFVSVYGILDAEKDLFDGVHPNAAGHEKIFRKVLPVVEEMIREDLG